MQPRRLLKRRGGYSANVFSCPPALFALLVGALLALGSYRAFMSGTMLDEEAPDLEQFEDAFEAPDTSQGRPRVRERLEEPLDVEIEEATPLGLSADDIESAPGAAEGEGRSTRLRDKARADATKRFRAGSATPPKTILFNAPPKLSRSGHPVLHFKADRPDCTFRIQLDNSDWISATSPLQFRNPLSDGWHVFTVKAVSPQGVEDPKPAQTVWKVDTIPPKATLDVFPTDPSSQTTAPFEVRSSEKRCTMPYTFDVRDKGSLQWRSVHPNKHTVTVRPLSVHRVRIEISNLTDAQYRFSVAAQDEAGNAGSPVVFVWNVDTTPPETVIHSGPHKLTNTLEASFIISAAGEDPSGYGYQYRLNGDLWHPGDTTQIVGSGYEFTLRNLQEGPTMVEIRTVDTAGNVDPTPSKHMWTVHVQAADTLVKAHPSPLTRSSSATFHIGCSESQYTFAYRLDGGPVMRPVGHKLVNGDVNFTVNDVTEGPHSIAIRTTDVTGAEDPTPVVVKWMVDLTPPKLTVVQRPPALTVRKEALFAISGNEEYRAMYRVDGGDWDKVDQSGSFHSGMIKFKVMDLYEGRHTLEVNATDKAGNWGRMDPIVWVVDLGPPKTVYLETPDKHSHSRKAIFHMQANEGDCTFEFRLDRGRWRNMHSRSSDVEFKSIPAEKATSGSMFTLHVLAGFHFLEIRATDANGNRDSDPAPFEWVVH
mmetsp:Transcript_39145/g.75015  ORF Transcript_39145/g.75015 Transcript_39145/m.75015 type:complete len:705 (+) Transcript_39145:154-2268(+)